MKKNKVLKGKKLDFELKKYAHRALLGDQGMRA
jgi:hypothetical protein